MVYIAKCQWINNSIYSVIFGYTESHLITDNSETLGTLEAKIIHIYYSYLTYTDAYNFINKRLDPYSDEGIWIVNKSDIYNSFEKARSSFFKKLFEGEK